MSLIGQSPPRPDGFAKVAGTAVYADDLVVPDLWFGATVRSPHPRARVDGVRFDSERAPAGAVCLTAGDLPGPNGVQLIDDSWPILAAGEVRHVGEAVAVVAAATRRQALEAARAVEVAYTPLPAVTTLEGGCSQPPLVELALDSGDVEAAFADPDLVVVEESYRTPHQEHIYIEPQAMTAWVAADGITVHGSMQCPYYVHKALTHAFGFDDDAVRVQASTVGGGFGGKEDYPSAVAIHAALLARASGHPVRLLYDRHEDIVATTKRHPALIRHRLAARSDGTLVALDIDITLDGGAYVTLSKVVLSRGVLHAGGPYRCPNVRIHGRVVATNTAPNGAFRGFGAPQVQLAAERQMDLLARRLGLDPLTVRRRNALVTGDTLPTGQVLDHTTSALACLDEVARKTRFAERWTELEQGRRAAGDGEPRRGLGLSLFFHGAGFTGNGERRMSSPVTVRLGDDGVIEVLTAMTDMGQGCLTVFEQIAAQTLGVEPSAVRLAPPDTAIVPDSGPTVASRTTMVVGGTIARALGELRGRLEGWWAEHGDGSPATVDDLACRHRREVGPLEVTIRHRPPDWQEFDEERYRGAAYPTYSWGADVAEVAVDADTLEVRPLSITSVCEVGTVIHPRLCAGQIEGGTLQAVGWATCEEIQLENGRYLNDRLATYIIPTAMDSPRIDVSFVENPFEGGPFGAKGVGELPMDGGAPAVAAAVEQATGIQVTELPATPERLLRWLDGGRRLGNEGDG